MEVPLIECNLTLSDDLTGDILQFGVDVMENSRKVTHGCIIATLKLYLPDGKEAKASPTIVNSTSNPALLSLSLPTQDLYQLNQYIQEALAREQVNCGFFLHKQQKSICKCSQMVKASIFKKIKMKD